MITPEETVFQEAITAVKAGDTLRARDLLTRLIKTNPNQPQYWLWMSAVVETPRELVYCLKEVLKRDPQNVTARRGLILQGELPPDPSLAIPAHLQRRKWENQAFAQETWQGKPAGPSRRSLALMIAAVVILAGVLVVTVLGFNRQQVPAFIAWIQRYTPAPTSNQPTEQPTLTSTLAPTLQPTGPAVFQWITATPTAFYVATPHRRTESFRSALNAMQQRDWNGAVNFLQQAIKEDNQPDLYYHLGEAYRMLARPKDAQQAFEKAIQMDPRFAPAYLGQARLLQSTSPALTSAIRTNLEKATALDSNYLEAKLELAAFWIDQNASDQALPILEEAERLNANSPALAALRARAYLATGQPQQALIYARQATQLDPGWLESYYGLAAAYRASGDLAASAAPLEIFNRYQPDHVMGLAWLAQAYAAQGDLSAALRLADQAVSIDSASFEARLTRALIYIDRQEPDKAKEELTIANRLRANVFRVYWGQGRTAQVAGDDAEAWRWFNQAQRLAGNDAESVQLYYWRALSLEALKQPIQALADWAEVQRLSAVSLTPAQRLTAQNHLQNLVASATPPTRTLPATSTATITPTPSPSAFVSPSSTTKPVP